VVRRALPIFFELLGSGRATIGGQALFPVLVRARLLFSGRSHLFCSPPFFSDFVRMFWAQSIGLTSSEVPAQSEEPFILHPGESPAAWFPLRNPRCRSPGPVRGSLVANYPIDAGINCCAVVCVSQLILKFFSIEGSVASFAVSVVEVRPQVRALLHACADVPARWDLRGIRVHAASVRSVDFQRVASCDSFPSSVFMEIKPFFFFPPSRAIREP